MFSTLGPDTLIELRRSWSAVDGFNHVNAFVDMHDIGDALLRARLTDPVMDAERITLTYQDVFGLMRDLKTLGAHNVSHGRARGLTGKGRLGAMKAAYEGFRRDGVLPATYEVVYGHAWAPEASQLRQRDDSAGVFPLNRLRRGGETTRV
jgi:malonyl-CoA O-methyltransferase